LGKMDEEGGPGGRVEEGRQLADQGRKRKPRRKNNWKRGDDAAGQ